jgi:hypothetical protein
MPKRRPVLFLVVLREVRATPNATPIRQEAFLLRRGHKTEATGEL